MAIRIFNMENLTKIIELIAFLPTCRAMVTFLLKKSIDNSIAYRSISKHNSTVQKLVQGMKSISILQNALVVNEMVHMNPFIIYHFNYVIGVNGFTALHLANMTTNTYSK